MKIMFVCRGNVGRSQMAEALFNMMTEYKHEVSSTGTIVRDKDGNDKNGQRLKDCLGAKNVILALSELRIDVSDKIRVQLEPGMLDGLDKMIVMSEPENTPKYLLDDPRTTYWEVEDPKNTDLVNHKITLLKIKKLLEEFIENNP